MSAACNPARGEAGLMVAGQMRVVRPSFAALVAAEAETGALLALVDRAAEGRVTLAEIEALLWHCLEGADGLARATLGEALMAQGIGAAMPALRMILRQVVAGSE